MTEKNQATVIEVPGESAPKKLRFDSVGYLLLHPEKRLEAVLWAVFRELPFLTASSWLVLEVVVFLCLLQKYGMMR